MEFHHFASLPSQKIDWTEMSRQLSALAHFIGNRGTVTDCVSGLRALLAPCWNGLDNTTRGAIHDRVLTAITRISQRKAVIENYHAWKTLLALAVRLSHF